MKKCSKCNLNKELTQFNKANNEKCGLFSWCKSCCNSNQKKYRLKYKGRYKAKWGVYNKRWRDKNKDKVYGYHIKYQYGISLQEYTELFDKQKGLCKLCHNPPANKRLAVDHNHQTGKIRGLLCSKCNTTLGWIEKSMGLEATIKYLTKQV